MNPVFMFHDEGGSGASVDPSSFGTQQEVREAYEAVYKARNELSTVAEEFTRAIHEIQKAEEVIKTNNENKRKLTRRAQDALTEIQKRRGLVHKS